LLSFRELAGGSIALLDVDREEVVWVTPGSWLSQHDADVTPDGHILLFDNRGDTNDTGRSRVIEVDPGNGGGNNWGSPAIDVEHQTLYVITMRVPNSLYLIPRETCRQRGRENQIGTPYRVSTDLLLSPLGIPCTAPPWATVDAVDLAAGRVLWSVPLGTTRDMAPFPFWWIHGVPAIGGLTVTRGGVVFAGGPLEHAFRAFDARTGAELWRARLPTAANATPMTFQLQAAGRQFVVIAAGGHMVGVNPPGDHLIAFALPERL